MEQRAFGRTETKLSVLGFGCGLVGGLMVRGAAKDQVRAVARAIEEGVNYFDTAPLYGDGASERNLGAALKELGAADVLVGSKCMIRVDDFSRIGSALTKSVETTLRLLGRDRLDLFQLHNPLQPIDQPPTTVRSETYPSLAPAVLLDDVAATFLKLKHQGKIRFGGITAAGDTDALHRIVEHGGFDSMQVVYNLLNPSAQGTDLRPGYPGQDFKGLLRRNSNAGIGNLAIRVLAGGALAGTIERHPLGAATVVPAATSTDYATDVAHAQRFSPLVDAGYAQSLAEAALRFVISSEYVTTAVVGFSNLDQLETALSSFKKGSLPTGAIALLPSVWESLAHETVA